MKDSIAYSALKVIGWLVARMPYRAVLALAYVVAHFVYFLDPRKETAYANLKGALAREFSPRKLRRFARLAYFHMAQTAIEILRFPVTTKKFAVDNVCFSEKRLLDKCFFKGKGVVMASGHLGSWEFGHFFLNAHGYPTRVVARTQPLGKLDHLLNEYRRSAGTPVTFRGMGVREVVRALRRGEVLATALDQSGGPEGVFVRFFGRLASFPAGMFKLARRSGAYLRPSFVMREGWGRWVTRFFESRESEADEDEETAVRRDIEYYVACLEKTIREFPEQWLWMHRRWKHTKTKFVTVLLDEKAGHRAQTLAVLEIVEKAFHSRDSSMEVVVSEIPVRFRSAFHRKAAWLLAFPLLPWLQGRLELVAWTLEPESAEAFRRNAADLVLSCGSSLLPLACALARENRAKKMVVMKPSFPYSVLAYDLVLVPEHDRPCEVRNSFFVDLEPNPVTPELIQNSGARLKEDERLPQSSFIAVFVGGETRSYRMDLFKLDFAFREIRSVAQESGARLLVTTSRRTSRAVEELARKHFAKDTLCSLLIIANEKNIEQALYGMMDLAKVIVVTEDSISMISESISSGRPVIVFPAGPPALRPKFERFQHLIQLRNYAVVSSAGELRHHLQTFLRREQSLSPCPDREKLAVHLQGAL